MVHVIPDNIGIAGSNKPIKNGGIEMRITLNMDPMRKEYHLPQCKAVKDIPDWCRMCMDKEQADRLGYRQCECCAGLSGFMNVFSKELELRRQNSGIELTYNKWSDTLYARTEMGFWKIFWKDQVGYVLRHLNKYDAEVPFNRLINGKFHKQSDVKPTENVMKLINYIEKHDAAKKIIEVNYRNLPQSTKRERKYYRRAARKERGRQIRRVYQIFDELEKETNLRELSIC